MTKKKKIQLKPVVRGFATTSIAKKVVPLDDLNDTGNIEEERPGTGNSVPGPALAQGDKLDAEKLEVQALQSLVEKLQEKTEKEGVFRSAMCIQS
jgi:ATP-dependent RNA helicase DHX29